MFYTEIPWTLTLWGQAAPDSGISSFLPLLGQLHLYLRLDFLPIHFNLTERCDEITLDKIIPSAGVGLMKQHS